MPLVIAEREGPRLRKSALELVAAARGAAGGEPVTIALLGPGSGEAAEEAARFAEQVVVSEDANLAPYDPAVHALAVAQLAEQAEASLVLIAGSRSGREYAPRVAVRLDAAYLEDVVSLERSDGTLRARRYSYLARVTETVEAVVAVSVVTVKPNALPAAEPLPEAGEVFEADLELSPPSVKVLERSSEKSARVALSDATVVVAGGRGLGTPENFRLVEELADVLGGAIAATRAAVDAGWRPYSEQVGQTGKTVQPNLYVAAGISGAVQHLSGMGKSRVIVAINKDPDAPIFKIADYGIVGDVGAILPAMTEAIKEIKR
jgi:electron transfer flavoprotein alpha subunit